MDEHNLPKILQKARSNTSATGVGALGSVWFDWGPFYDIVCFSSLPWDHGIGWAFLDLLHGHVTLKMVASSICLVSASFFIDAYSIKMKTYNYVDGKDKLRT
jgi:hypothetical protein